MPLSTPLTLPVSTPADPPPHRPLDFSAPHPKEERRVAGLPNTRGPRASAWSAMDVVEWCEGLDVPGAGAKFAAKGINGAALKDLTMSSLRDIGFDSLPDRVHILREILIATQPTVTLPPSEWRATLPKGATEKGVEEEVKNGGRKGVEVEVNDGERKVGEGSAVAAEGTAGAGARRAFKSGVYYPPGQRRQVAPAPAVAAPQSSGPLRLKSRFRRAKDQAKRVFLPHHDAASSSSSSSSPTSPQPTSLIITAFPTSASPTSSPTSTPFESPTGPTPPPSRMWTIKKPNSGPPQILPKPEANPRQSLSEELCSDLLKREGTLLHKVAARCSEDLECYKPVTERADRPPANNSPKRATPGPPPPLPVRMDSLNDTKLSEERSADRSVARSRRASPGSFNEAREGAQAAGQILDAPAGYKEAGEAGSAGLGPTVAPRQTLSWGPRVPLHVMNPDLAMDVRQARVVVEDEGRAQPEAGADVAPVDAALVVSTPPTHRSARSLIRRAMLFSGAARAFRSKRAGASARDESRVESEQAGPSGSQPGADTPIDPNAENCHTAHSGIVRRALMSTRDEAPPRRSGEGVRKSGAGGGVWGGGEGGLVCWEGGAAAVGAGMFTGGGPVYAGEGAAPGTVAAGADVAGATAAAVLSTGVEATETGSGEVTTHIALVDVPHPYRID
ncbi:hypothetical protein BDK51DRAFT_44328 [Blyttiomyces helicus]|uniref:SAM domain-containing protein n=1 Tax=Blyttiomyces helicus TaxID=388810 RepID=A0A4P9WFI4_9FUNG|nr:hypothetical protein BDK51DRAFT_44328 [Blyttiomyces helicus]|eukprot:RKO89780.1 hypothetical protein BDK51DRAFT_44328 [Blyttiomyces helicus]